MKLAKVLYASSNILLLLMAFPLVNPLKADSPHLQVVSISHQLGLYTFVVVNGLSIPRNLDDYKGSFAFIPSGDYSRISVGYGAMEAMDLKKRYGGEILIFVDVISMPGSQHKLQLRSVNGNVRLPDGYVGIQEQGDSAAADGVAGHFYVADKKEDRDRFFTFALSRLRETKQFLPVDVDSIVLVDDQGTRKYLTVLWYPALFRYAFEKWEFAQIYAPAFKGGILGEIDVKGPGFLDMYQHTADKHKEIECSSKVVRSVDASTWKIEAWIPFFPIKNNVTVKCEGESL